MIRRYTSPDMGRIWSQENRYRRWLDVELAVCEVQAKRGAIPKSAWKIIKEKAHFDIKRIDEIEATVQHDVIAFLTNVSEQVGPESRFIHLGMTSSDVLDTATSLQLKESNEILIKDLNDLIGVLKRRALEYRQTPCIGRSHGMHAEPTSFGLKMALWYEEARRNMRRLRQAADEVEVGKISGAVGTFAHLEPEVEEEVCRLLGIHPEPVSTQVVQRDRHAFFLNTLAVIGASLEKIATEIRHLQRTELMEVEEFFSTGQKGSSAMPHKRNPITSERICGLARLMRTYAQAGLENVALWHERDISHSSVERIILPDSTTLLDYMLKKTIQLVDQLIVYPDNMMENLHKTKGLIFSQNLMLSLIKKDLTREVAYRLIQDVAMDCSKSGKSFKEEVLKDPDISKYLTAAEITACFDLKVQLRNIDRIFKRIGLLE